MITAAALGAGQHGLDLVLVGGALGDLRDGEADPGEDVRLDQLLRQHPTPSELQLLVIDPKQVDFLIFEDLPHLYGGALVTDPLAAVGTLAETIDDEIERRQPLLKRAGVTSAIEFYEQGGSRTELPQLLVVIDEFADLAGTPSRAERQDFLGLVQRYGQLTRAFGIYLVLAT